MDVKQIKAFTSSQGVQVSTYRKPELIQLAKAVALVDLPTDPDFESESIEECLLRSHALPVEQKILVKLCLNLMIFFQIKESLSPLYLHIGTPS